jgi:hypothetical protein
VPTAIPFKEINNIFCCHSAEQLSQSNNLSLFESIFEKERWDIVSGLDEGKFE